ncbi:hypothetical protein NLJ89_g3379 [Agrocybe chaxingu]|uniref:Protein kinase domain-containing protein n=1 Tax=Agrocybe chaxingu TaxID=84603 RepID=A0A9W8KB53_9AGAR|nr:hypothetical protein NLJ89_g3379 [Agrocybe chaxingu]
MIWKKKFWARILRRKPAHSNPASGPSVVDEEFSVLDSSQQVASSTSPSFCQDALSDRVIVPLLDGGCTAAASFPGNQEGATRAALSCPTPIYVGRDLPSTPSPNPTNELDTVRDHSLPPHAAMSSSPANTETTLPAHEPYAADQLKLPEARDALALIEVLCETIEGLGDLIRVAHIAKEKIVAHYGIDMLLRPQLAPAAERKLPSPLDLDCRPRKVDEAIDAINEEPAKSIDPTDDDEEFVYPAKSAEDPPSNPTNSVVDDASSTPVRFPEVPYIEDPTSPPTFGSRTADGHPSSPRTSPRGRATSMDNETLSTPRVSERLFDQLEGVPSRPATIHEIGVHSEETEERHDTSSVHSLLFSDSGHPGLEHPRVQFSHRERHLHSFRSTPRMPFDISTQQNHSEPIAEGRTSTVSRVLRSALGADYEAIKSVDLKKQSEVTLKWCAREVQMMKTLYDLQRGPLPYRPGTPENARDYIINFPSDPLENCIWIDPFGTLNISTCYYPYNLSQFRGVSPISSPDETIAQHAEPLYFVLYELTQGLRFLHSLGIVHLDIQPSNIFLTSTRHCVIGDFGGSVSGAWEEAFDTSLVTYAPRAFAAPELLEASTFDSRADFWSLGMTMFDIIVPDGIELLLGAEEDMEAKQAGYPFRGPKKLGGMMRNKKCPEDVINQVTNMLQKGPLDRAHGKSMMKYLKDHHWQEKFTTSDASPLLNYDPVPRALLATASIDIVPTGLPAREVIRKLREEVHTLCEYDVHIRG